MANFDELRRRLLPPRRRRPRPRARRVAPLSPDGLMSLCDRPLSNPKVVALAIVSSSVTRERDSIDRVLRCLLRRPFPGRIKGPKGKQSQLAARCFEAEYVTPRDMRVHTRVTLDCYAKHPKRNAWARG